MLPETGGDVTWRTVSSLEGTGGRSPVLLESGPAHNFLFYRLELVVEVEVEISALRTLRTVCGDREGGGSPLSKN